LEQENSMKRTLTLATTLLAAGLLGSAPAHAGVLYDSTGNPRYANPADANPLSFNVGFNTDILWDDAPIATNALANPFVEVNRLSFDILRVANAPAVDIDIYWANMVPDAGANRGTNNIPLDSPVDDPGPANFVQRISLAANGGTATRQIISVGNGVDTLFTTGVLDTSTPDAQYIDGTNFNYPVGTHPGYGYFMVGLKFSTTAQENLWVIASDPNNLFWVTDDFQDANPSTIDEFYFGVDDQDVPIAGTMSMKVEGNLVPEPASLATLGIAALGLLARRRMA
jgi:hypothetical protein